MLDFLRNLTKSAEEKRQEQIDAYVSNSLSSVETRQFEAEMAQDADLQAEVDARLQLRQAMRSMPQRRARRSFALDPAKYGKPQPQRLGQFYPMVRTATALTAVFLVIAIGAEFFTTGSGQPIASFPTVQQESADSVAMGAQDTADEAAFEETAAEPEPFEEEMMAEEMVEEAEEMADEAMAEEMADDSALEEEALPAEVELAEEALELSDEGSDEAAAESATEPQILGTQPPQPSVDTPRVSATPTLDDRALDVEEVAEAEVEIEETAVSVTEDSATTLSTESDELLEFNDSANFEPPAQSTSPISPLRLAQIGLAIILIGLLMLLRASRMQR
ncbi:MAG: hypothetical protein AAF490_14990 [Chloroflexota bacterium]